MLSSPTRIAQGPEIPAKNQCCPAKCVENPNASNCNQKCDNTWAPVCGTDLTTYNNKCQLSLVACTLNDDTLKVRSLYALSIVCAQRTK